MAPPENLGQQSPSNIPNEVPEMGGQVVPYIVTPHQCHIPIPSQVCLSLMMIPWKKLTSRKFPKEGSSMLQDSNHIPRSLGQKVSFNTLQRITILGIFVDISQHFSDHTKDGVHRQQHQCTALVWAVASTPAKGIFLIRSLVEILAERHQLSILQLIFLGHSFQKGHLHCSRQEVVIQYVTGSRHRRSTSSRCFSLVLHTASAHDVPSAGQAQGCGSSYQGP